MGTLIRIEEKIDKILKLLDSPAPPKPVPQPQPEPEPYPEPIPFDPYPPEPEPEPPPPEPEPEPPPPEPEPEPFRPVPVPVTDLVPNLPSRPDFPQFSYGYIGFTKREPATGEIVIDEAPFVCDRPGNYILTSDISTDSGTAISIKADNVVIDVNGHIVKFKERGIVATQKDGPTRLNVVNFKVHNGVVQKHHGIVGEAIILTRAKDSHVHNMIVQGGNICVNLGSHNKIDHCTIMNLSTESYNTYPIRLGERSEIDKCHVSGGTIHSVRNFCKVTNNYVENKFAPSVYLAGNGTISSNMELSSPNGDALMVSNAFDSDLHHYKISTSYGRGIYVVSSEINIDNCIVSTTNDSAVHVEGCAENIKIASTIFRAKTHDNSRGLIKIDNCTGKIKFVGCIFESNFVIVQPHGVVHDCIFENCTFRGLEGFKGLFMSNRDNPLDMCNFQLIDCNFDNCNVLENKWDLNSSYSVLYTIIERGAVTAIVKWDGEKRQQVVERRNR
jgi:hypothetical protein